MSRTPIGTFTCRENQFVRRLSRCEIPGTDQPVVVRIGRLVAPTALADYLAFVQCGLLVPISLEPSKVEEFSGTYRLKGSLPEGVSQLSLTYDFRLLR